MAWNSGDDVWGRHHGPGAIECGDVDAWPAFVENGVDLHLLPLYTIVSISLRDYWPVAFPLNNRRYIQTELKMNFVELRQATDAAMREALTSAGFRRTAAGTWNRKKWDDLNIIWFQRHTANPSFCVNLGIHYSFIPKAGSMDVPEGDQIKQPECAIKMRLTSDPSMKDQRWPIAASSVGQVADLVCSRGLPIFDSYRLDGPIASIEVKDVEAGTAILLSSLTEVGGCLLLARMHEHLGHRDKSVEAATIGVKLAGRMAVGPKKALKDILKRLG